jgi:hypothetical protein
MSAIRAAFKALTPEQRMVISERRLAGERSPDEWLALLEPVLAYDRQAEAVQRGAGGWFARRFARRHRLAAGIRSFAAPLLPVLREDQDPACPLELAIDLTGPRQDGKVTGKSDPYKKGAYHKIVDTFYDDPWLAGHARFVDGADVRFAAIDHVRSSRKTKRTPRGKVKTKTKGKKKTELVVTASFPARNYAIAQPGDSSVPLAKESVRTAEKRTVVRLQRVIPAASLDEVPDPDTLLELLAAAYARVDPSRRKKL